MSDFKVSNGSFTHTHVSGGNTTVLTGAFTASGLSRTYTVNGVYTATVSGIKPSAGDPARRKN